MTSDRDALAEVVGAVLQGIDQTEIPDDGWWETSGGADFGAQKKDELIDAILAAGWRPPKPPCEHRMIVHGGACGSCGQMPPPPTKEDLALLRTALARVERDNGSR